jgi:hypothetical protein
MAETYEVDFAVSMTPKVKNDDVQGATQYYMDDEIAKSLGGSGVSGGIDGTTIGATADEVSGWAAGVPTYVTSNGGSIPSGAADTAMAFVKNTGHLYSSPSVLGSAVTKTSGKWTAAEAIKVSLGGGTKADVTLYPGEAIVLPRLSAGAIAVATVSGVAHLAVEYARITT